MPGRAGGKSTAGTAKKAKAKEKFVDEVILFMSPLESIPARGLCGARNCVSPACRDERACP
jgi:hypothetical protein